MLSILLLSLVALSSASSNEFIRTVRHENERLIRFPYSKDLVRAVDRLELDVWARNPTAWDIRVKADKVSDVTRMINNPGKVIVNDLQQLIDNESVMLQEQSLAPALGPEWHKQYHKFNDINKWLQDLAAQYPTLVKYVASIGKSVEGRDIPLVKITSPVGDYSKKKRVWFQGMQHAREWISGATMQFLADNFVSKYGSDARITKVLDATEIIIVPVCNPDGYEYTWNGDRLWRKTRAVVRGKKYGVDPNRNWPDHWGTGGSSTSPSSETYMGPSAGSEPEVKALMAAYSATPNVIAAVDFHSYSQLILRPYGWTEDNSPDDAAFTAFGESIRTAISKASGNRYTNERVVDLYVASGGSNDWWYGIGTSKGTQKPYGIAIELPPADSFGGQGFILAPEKIVPVGNEILPAALSMIEYALANPLGTQ